VHRKTTAVELLKQFKHRRFVAGWAPRDDYRVGEVLKEEDEGVRICAVNRGFTGDFRRRNRLSTKSKESARLCSRS